MPFDHDRHIGDDTEVLNDEPEVCYAEVRCGPWSVQFNRGRPEGAYEHLHARDAQFTIEGPLINGDHTGGQHIVREDDGGPLSFDDMHEVLDACGGWNYVELAEELD